MSSYLADLLLLCVALIWGLTFPAIKNALTGIDPYSFMTIRFFLASIFLIFVFIRKLKKINIKLLKAGLLIGSVLFLGYAFQTIGIQYTTASNAAFITGLAVVIVPILNYIFFQKKPNSFVMLGGICATFGLALLSLNESLTINKGDLLILFCAVSFAMHIILVSKFAPTMDSDLLTIIQIGTVAVVSLFFSKDIFNYSFNYSNDVWIALGICAIPATSLAYLIQNKVQQFTSSAKTAIVFSMEPVFGALFSYLWMGEILATKDIIGCILVLVGMLLAELKS